MPLVFAQLPTPPQLPVYAEIDEVKTNIYEPVDLQSESRRVSWRILR